MRWNTYHQTAQQLEEKAQEAAQQYKLPMCQFAEKPDCFKEIDK